MTCTDGHEKTGYFWQKMIEEKTDLPSKIAGGSCRFRRGERGLLFFDIELAHASA
jgi:hypothetical protein